MNLQQHHAPYRYHAHLCAAVIPPDRRRLKAALFGVSCFVAGALATIGGAWMGEAIAEEQLGMVVPVEHRSMHPVVVQVEEPVPVAVPYVPPHSSDSDTAREVLLNDPLTSKQILMPIVASGLGSAEDERVLKAACERLKDRPCLDFLRGRESTPGY